MAHVHAHLRTVTGKQCNIHSMHESKSPLSPSMREPNTTSILVRVELRRRSPDWARLHAYARPVGAARRVARRHRTTAAAGGGQFEAEATVVSVVELAEPQYEGLWQRRPR